MKRPRDLYVLVLGGLTAASVLLFAEDIPSMSAIVTTREQRESYLAHATIWRDRPPISPAEIRKGPAGTFPYTVEQATSGDAIRCTFETPGKELSGDSPKFLCRAEDGGPLRLKYWDPIAESGNREVFATVVASRLMWALGFNALPALPVKVSCDDCPENPMSGQGARASRPYMGLLQERLHAPLIVSKQELDQGWSWHELDEAIAALPPGRERQHQRTHFDALTLLGVFLQHGDRKPEQQAIYCDTPIDVTAGVIRSGSDRDVAWLTERPLIPVCKQAAVVIVDVGATFGGAGRLSRESTAKMNFEEWRKRPIFLPESHPCRGNLISSAAAGDDGEPNPIISEDGRRFLLEHLHRLTPDHVRALFEAARVDRFVDRRQAKRHDGNAHSVDEWAAAFEEKVREIEARTCGR